MIGGKPFKNASACVRKIVCLSMNIPLNLSMNQANFNKALDSLNHKLLCIIIISSKIKTQLLLWMGKVIKNVLNCLYTADACVHLCYVLLHVFVCVFVSSL